MKKSTLIMAMGVLLSAGGLFAQEGLPVDGSADSGPSAPPLLIASALPGMRSSVETLPGMASAGQLPLRIITDVTNFPNPFDSRKSGLEGRTQISYSLAQDAVVSVEIFDLFGRKVQGWEFPAGTNGGRQGSNMVSWDGTDAGGRKVSKGGYVAQIVIETPQTVVTAVRKIGVIH